MTASAVRIVSVFPDLLGTYGDGGNVQVLERRLVWRGLAVEVVPVRVGDVLPTTADLYVLGGGEDVQQLRALEALKDSGLGQAVDQGAHVFAVCAGLQLLGRTLDSGDGTLRDGVGLLDLATTRLARRVVGEVRADAGHGLPLLTGFANHGGGSVLGPQAQPLAHVVSGQGNDGTAHGPEGALQGRVVATYLHGPVLARNPALADWLLERVMGQPLEPLPPGPPEALHDHRVAHPSRGGRG